MTSGDADDGPRVQTIFVRSIGGGEAGVAGGVPVIRQLATSDAVFRLRPARSVSKERWNEETPSDSSCSVT